MIDVFGEDTPFDDVLAHYGILRKSGRYPWGSGDNPYQNNQNFLSYVDGLRKKGMTNTEIAKGVGITTTQLRALTSIATTQNRKAMEAQAVRLKDKGLSNVAIGQRMGINESSVRSLLNPATRERSDILQNTANILKDNVAKKGYLDIGVGVENHLGVSNTKLRTAVAVLEEEGYKVHYVKVKQLGTGKETTVKVLAPPGVSYSEIYKNQDKIGSITDHSDDGGRSFLGLRPPQNVDSKRVAVRYDGEGGSDMDGVIELRRGVDDLSLGNARYAQVRVAVDGTHYLKGMAMYADDLPDGVDIRFNTNKNDTGNKLDALKPLKKDPANPNKIDPDNAFGATIKAGGQRGALNIVNEEGDWSDWSKNLPSQMLSKQPTPLAKRQLDIAYKARQTELNEIMNLTNPSVKRKLLESFADGADSASVHLKAAALPRQGTHVILPISSLKSNEIYAPNYQNGDQVVLVRFPHGGIFEIPELTVNNRNKDANRLIKNARDAVGINSEVAARLSGADFDGDTVLVIPNNDGAVKSSSPLQGLKNFDPQRMYPGYDGMPKMTPDSKQHKMGDVSNLITDMTIRGATNDELARAVRHSMVVIDAEKHNLNWRQSAIDNGISELKTKYQGGPTRGASTLISKASSDQRVLERKNRPASEGGAIDKETGERRYVNTDASYVNAQGQTVFRTTKSTKMAEAKDARDLSSGTPMENIYADHANRLKAMANTARKEMVATKSIPYSPSAKKTFSKEVATLNAKLNVALMNAPLERQAQLLANATVAAKKQARPDMDSDDLKKVKNQALAEARIRTGAGKKRIDITPDEWKAIQAGAISSSKLDKILSNSDLDKVKELATPRTSTGLSPAMVSRAEAMIAAGRTQAEVASLLGVSTSTLSKAMNS